MNRDILQDALKAPAKSPLAAQRESVDLLRVKGYSWREIASFLSERGVKADHTSLYRLVNGRGTMAGSGKHENYDQIRGLIRSIGGDMTWVSGGASGGGSWHLSLYGKTLKVRVPNNQVNTLDRLYEARVAEPKTWEDYDEPAPLTPDAFWRLVTIFNEQSKGQ